MPLQPMQEMLARAQEGGYAAGYFEPWDQYSMEAVLRAAERMRTPVILGCGGLMMDREWFDSGGMHALAAAAKVAAERASVPAALLLNEAVTLDQIARGLACGFNALLLDTSHLGFEENVRATREVVELARPYGAAVEAELGQLPFGSGDEDGAEPSLTDPDQAAEFVERTGVDALAVSIGNVHVQLHGTSDVDLDLLGRISRKVKVPLVIHGFTGFPESAVRAAISLGVAKFNVGTVFKKLFIDGLREALADTPEDANPHRVVGSRGEADVVARACRGIQREVERLMTLFAAGKQGRPPACLKP